MENLDELRRKPVAVLGAGVSGRGVGALLLADIAHIAGLVAAGLHPSPVGHADFVTTTTHKTLRGPRGGLVLCGEKHAKAIDSQTFPGIQGGPLMHVIAAKAVAFREAAQPAFAEYCRRIVHNADVLARCLDAKGFHIVSGGTDNHLFLLSLVGRETSGKLAQSALERAGITVNKNMVPFDPRKPMVTSGVRIGTPAVTTRGMGEEEIVQVADANFAEVTSQVNQYVRSANETVEGHKSALKEAEQRHAAHVGTLATEARAMLEQQAMANAKVQEEFVKHASNQAERLEFKEEKQSAAESGKNVFVGQMVTQ